MIELSNNRSKDFIRINIALMATAFTTLLGLLQVNTLDTDLQITAFCCSVVFPISFCFGIMLQIYEKIQISEFLYGLLKYSTILDIFIASIGLISLIKHFSIIAEIAFAVCEIVAIIVYEIGVSSNNEKIEEMRNQVDNEFKEFEEIEKKRLEEIIEQKLDRRYGSKNGKKKQDKENAPESEKGK